jgi:hypothetical protein
VCWLLGFLYPLHSSVMSLSLNGTSSLDCVSAIRSGRFDWKLRVRVVRIWEVTGHGVSDDVSSLEIILVDEFVSSPDCAFLNHHLFLDICLFLCLVIDFILSNVISMVRGIEFRQRF